MMRDVICAIKNHTDICVNCDFDKQKSLEPRGFD